MFSRPAEFQWGGAHEHMDGIDATGVQGRFKADIFKDVIKNV